jgi:cytochrome P450
MLSCPVDLFDPEVQENWYPAYEVLREHHRVYQIPDTSIYVITHYKDIIDVVRDTDTYSNEPEKHGGDLLIEHAEARAYYVEHGLGKEHSKGRWAPLGMDPPEHRKYRRLIDRLFLGTPLTRARPFIEEIISTLIDRFEDAGEIDFVSGFAEPLPMMVITRMIGFPDEDAPLLRKWSASWAKPFERQLTLEQEMVVAKDGVDFQNYIMEHVKRRRTKPADYILTHLSEARFGEERPLTDHEIASMIDHLYIGGNETTTFALTSGLWLYLRDPEIYRTLLEDPGKIKLAIEESLRLESPTQGLFRTAVRDTEIAGVPIPKGATVHIRFGAANRDKHMFGNPECFDLNRANPGRHLAFSIGEHHCPGSALSRLEQTLSFEQLFKRLPNLRLAEGKNDFRHYPGLVLRALRELHLEFDPVTKNHVAGTQ